MYDFTCVCTLVKEKILEKFKELNISSSSIRNVGQHYRDQQVHKNFLLNITILVDSVKTSIV